MNPGIVSLSSQLRYIGMKAQLDYNKRECSISSPGENKWQSVIPVSLTPVVTSKEKGERIRKVDKGDYMKC